MSTYVLLPLRFLSSVHFGDASGGGGLDAVQLTCRADTFFSALCVEAAKLGSKTLARLVDKAQAGQIAFSDLLPWYQRDGNYEWYLPKPVLSVTPAEKKIENLQTVRAESSFRKKSKKRAFIRASELGLYVDDLRYGSASLTEEPTFGTAISQVHFNGRSRSPYSAGSYYLAKQAGLYSLIRLEEKEDIQWLSLLIHLTGLSGIGGRRSSGMGRFQEELHYLLLHDGAENEDTEALYQLLTDTEAEEQMCLSSLLPQKEEIEIAAAGKGLWVQRSGLSWSQGMDVPVKMHTIYMMAAGSCFSKRLKGRIADVSTPASPHPVYRYGKGLYVGVPK